MPAPIPKHVAEAVEEAAPTRVYKRGRFIPVSKRDLEELLRRHVEPDAAATAGYCELCGLLEEVIHREYHQLAASVKDIYTRFDPDADVHQLHRTVEPQQMERETDELFKHVRFLLEKANFRSLPREEVDAAVGAVSPWGLNLQVDLNVFHRLEIWARGDKIDHRARRTWRSWFRLQHFRVPLYQRLMLVFQPRTDSAGAGYSRSRIHLKLFKNIPEGDVDMVLPGTSVRMTLVDRGKILFPVVSGVVVTAWKIIKGALLVAAVGVYGLLAYAMLILGTIGYGWRSFFGYRRTKEKYQLNLTQNLYYQKLDTDWGALLRLCDEAEDQEYREALTAWFLLWRQAGDQGWMMEELDRSAERLLQAELKRDVDFDVTDAVDKLIRWHLVDVQHDGRLTARSPERAIASLRERLRAT